MSKRGKCGKGKPYQKQGLTPFEQARLAAIEADNRQRWERLLSLNAWKPQPSAVAAKGKVFDSAR